MVKNMKFLDKAKIRIISGHGGNGMVAWRREKYVDKGGPAGGDGGRGGDIYFVADENMSTLLDFKLKSVFKAPSGENGGIKGMHGACAKDLYIKVPLGTVVKDSKTGKIIADLTENEQTVLVAKGGRGGRGNARFATAQKRAPQFCEPGEPGIERVLELELKLIADIGLLGMPNAGKSTFISAVSSARPKIADYPFTTLVPHLGVVKKADGGSYVLADIPGLIEGASEGIGLGHEFLRHVERCRLIVHVVDVSGIEGRDPEDDFEKINYELKNFSEEISERPQIVVMNKCDLASEEQIAKFRKYIEDKGLPCFECSAATTKGTAQVIEYIAGELDKLPPPIRFEAQPLTARELDEQELKKKEFTITKQDGIYIVDAPFMVPVLSMVNMEDYESLQYFQRVLRFSGIIDKLEEMGVQEDDTVSIYDFEFRYLR